MTSRTDGVVILAVLLTTASMTSLFFLNLLLGFSAHWSPLTDDVYLYRLDRLIGYDSLRIMDLYPRLGLLCSISKCVYLSLPFALMAGVGSVILRQTSQSLVPRLAVAAVLGFILYQLVPAVGPGMLPASVLTGPARRVPVDVGMWRNAFPSLHFTWALLLFPAWGRAWTRWTFGLAFVVLTAARCLGDGQHYLVDLIAAVPLTVLIVWLFPNEQRRRSK